MEYSEHERRKALDAVDLFREQDTRDELGIGTVRDALSDLLFPGTNTIQTRARYFLFVPWIYLELERLRVPAGQASSRARREEIALIDGLVRSGELEGVIGIEARAGLKRLPSNIYWLGLGRWGVRLLTGSQQRYHLSLDGFYAANPRFRQRSTDEGESAADGPLLRNWHAGLPPMPDGFPRRASFRLTRVEAEYLRERLLTHVPGTLLAWLVDRGSPFPRVDFPWRELLTPQMPRAIGEQVEHARAFSEAIHGAALLYNLMLAKRSDIEERVEHYTTSLEHWRLVLAERAEAMSAWNRRRFWQIVVSGGARIPATVRAFVDAWLDLALAAPGAVVANDRARRLIHERERSIKRDRARLDNRRALEMWSGAAGTAQLNYRWPVAQSIILDILAGLRRSDEHA